MADFKLKSWVYLDDDLADEGERNLLIFFYIDDQLYKATIAESDIRFTLSLTSISKYLWIADERNNTITIDIDNKPVTMSHSVYFHRHFSNEDALKIAKLKYKKGEAGKLKDNKIR